MVPAEVHVQWQAVVQVGEGDTVLGSHRLPDDDLVDVVKLVPVLLPGMEWGSNQIPAEVTFDLTGPFLTQ